MRIEGSYTFQAPREVVWDAIMDPEVMGRALPGGEKLERISETEYVGVMDVRVGPVQGKFSGKIELLEAVRPERCVMKVDGRGAPGFISGSGSWELAADGNATVMTYSGDVDVGGRIANVGQRLLESSAKSLTRQGLEALDAQIQARMAPPPAAEPAAAEVAAAEPAPAAEAPSAEPAPAAPSAAPPPPPHAAPPPPSAARVAMRTAKDVASDLASDYIPPEKQKSVVYFVLGALSMLLFVVLVRLVQEK
ncbi:MAG: carbon monoxide dehydrogenase subunit G [Caldilineales bacterium]|nr:carbon monoxide dehydrogenase subunit G [Caldilineales bacterium]MDW8319269.1 carbon monoxide dehydrogenase subunit G [Anaerolineae bacterium]